MDYEGSNDKIDGLGLSTANMFIKLLSYNKMMVIAKTSVCLNFEVANFLHNKRLSWLQQRNYTHLDVLSCAFTIKT